MPSFIDLLGKLTESVQSMCWRPVTHADMGQL